MTAGFATATTPDPKQRIHCSLSALQGGLPVPPRDSEGPYSASETPAVTATLPIEPRSARKRLVSGPAACASSALSEAHAGAHTDRAIASLAPLERQLHYRYLCVIMVPVATLFFLTLIVAHFSS